MTHQDGVIANENSEVIRPQRRVAPLEPNVHGASSLDGITAADTLGSTYTENSTLIKTPKKPAAVFWLTSNTSWATPLTG